MKVVSAPMQGLLVLEPNVFSDERGWFFESFNAAAFEQVTGEAAHFVQDNQSYSKHGVLRGLHYQDSPHAQAKLVRVVEGEVWDVAVDLRRDSATYGQWFGAALSAKNKRQMWIPAGFAHGFLTLSSAAQVLYKTTAFYSPEHERCLLWNDADLAIAWPLDQLEAERSPDQALPIVSVKDQRGSSWGTIRQIVR